MVQQAVKSIVDKPSPYLKRRRFNKRVALFASLVGFIASVLGIYQFFSQDTGEITPDELKAVTGQKFHDKPTSKFFEAIMNFFKTLIVFLLMAEIGYSFQGSNNFKAFENHNKRLVYIEKQLPKLIEDLKNNKLDNMELKKLLGDLKKDLDSLKTTEGYVDARLNELEKSLNLLKEARNSLNEADQQKIDQLESVINQLLESKTSLENYIQDLASSNIKNAQELMALKKLFNNYINKNFADNIPADLQKADQILKQIQAFTQIKRIADTRNGQSLIYNFQLSESRNGKQIPLAGRQLVVGEQVLDGEVEESFTIDTDKDGIASFEASVEKRRQMNKRQAYFVVKFKGDALRKDATSSKFR